MEQEERYRDSVSSRFLETCDSPLHEQKIEPFILVIFGGTGDLSKRKLLPTLFSLFRSKQFAGESHVLGVGRHEMSDGDYRGLVRQALETFGGDDLRDLYVTTALTNSTRAEEGGGAGALFHLRPGVRGVPEFFSRIGIE